MDYESEHTVEEWVDISSELDIELNEEAEKWQVAQIHDGMVSINARIIQLQVNTILTMLKKMGVTKEELHAVFQAEMLEALKHDRKMLQKQKREQLGLAVPTSKIIGPNGKIIT